MTNLKTPITFGLILCLLCGALLLPGCDFIRRSDVKKADKGEFTNPTRLPLVVDEKSTFKKGEKVTVCRVTVSIDEMERKPGAGAGGKDLVRLKVSVTNETTQEEFAIIPFDFYLDDGQGKTIEISYSASLDEPMEAGPLSPGQTISGELAYDVPADRTNLSFFWMPGWCSDKVLIKLSE